MQLSKPGKDNTYAIYLHVLQSSSFLALLWLPMSDRTVFVDSCASGGRLTIFPISHTVNNSTFNIKTDGCPGGNNSSELLISLSALVPGLEEVYIL